MTADVEKWGFFEATFAGPKGGNPFADATLDVEFVLDNRRMKEPGLYDGEGVYRVRFMPDTEGDWRYRTRSNAPALDGVVGTFTCAPPRAGNHGSVRVRNRHHFVYADGTPFFPFGTTCYAWTHQPLAIQRETLRPCGSPASTSCAWRCFPSTISSMRTSRFTTFTNATRMTNSISTERRAVAQRARLTRQPWHIAPKVVDRLAPAKAARMLGHDPSVLAVHDAIGVGVDIDRAADRAGADRVLVVVEPNQAGLRHRSRQGVESVEAAAIGDERRPFFFEDLPDRLLGPLGMGARLRPG